MKTTHAIGLFVAAVVLLSGCSETVDIKPVVEVMGRPAMNAAVGVYHSPEFRNYQFTADVYGNGFTFIFPLGSSSEAMLKSLYPKVFKSIKEVNAMPTGASDAKDVATVLVPEIESFQFPLQCLLGPYWAEIRYRFTLYSPQGEKLISWTAKGWGEGGDGTLYGEFGPIADATNMAMQMAAMKFVSSFDQVPEVKRWKTGMPMDGAVADPQLQVFAPSPGGSGEEFDAGYPGVVAVHGHMNADPRKDNPQGKKALVEVGIRAIELTIRNDGIADLLVDPLQIAWTPDGKKEVFPVSVSLISSVMTNRHLKIGPVATGTGVAALPSLLISLYNASATMDEEKQIKENLALFGRRELKEAIIRPSETINGLLYFPTALESGTDAINIPVIDVENAVCYMVHVPTALR